MTEQERDSFGRALCDRWDTFMGADLKLWWDEFNGIELCEFVDALTKHRNTKSRRPTPADIRKLLPRMAVVAAPATRRKAENGGDTFADVLRLRGGKWAEMSDAEAYVQHFRGLWDRESRNLLSGNAPDRDDRLNRLQNHIEIQCRNYLMQVEGIDRAEADRMVTYVFDTADNFRILLMELRGELAAF